MTFDNVYKRFKVLSGLDDTELCRWMFLVKDAIDYIESFVINRTVNQSQTARLENAAAVYAYYLYVSYSSVEHNSVSAGDFSVNYNTDRIKKAEGLWKTQLDNLSDIIKSDFVFKRVK